MNVQLLKTKAEEALVETFENVLPKLPGGPRVQAARKSAIGQFGTLGLPHRRIEEWKYTDLRATVKEVAAPAVDDKTKVSEAEIEAALGTLAAVKVPRVVFVNGHYDSGFSKLPGKGVEVSSLKAALERDDAGAAFPDGRDADAVLSLNTAYAADGAVVTVSDGAKLAEPLLLVFVKAGPKARFVATRNVVRIGAGATATLVEAFVTVPGSEPGGQSNAATDIVVGDGAEVSHIKVVLDDRKATHLANWIVGLGADAGYRGFQFTADTALARNQISVVYGGEGGKLDLSGIFLGRESEHIDTTLVVDHAVPKCESRELFKGVLDGRARGIFQGKIIVRPDAQKTDGKQMAQALMLSSDAEFDSKPELEIYADDVICGHGSTAAEIDEELIFYCKSRGIPEAIARALLIESFIGEAADRVEHDGLREALMSVVRTWLGATTR
jgi:Fe-S cluster assembly protein SufD